MSNRARAPLPFCVFALGLLSAGLFPISARAQEKIQSIRLGRHADYQRIVLEVPDGVAAYTGSGPERIEIDAEPPALEPTTRDQLAAIGVKLEGSAGKTRIILEPRTERPWAAFRLKQGTPRIVVDLGAGAPGIPDDAEPLRELASAPQPASPPVALPDVSVDPPPAPVRPSNPTPDRAEVRVRVDGLDLVGLPAEGPTRADILALDLSVRRTQGGDWEAARGAADAKQVSLRELTSSAGGSGLMGSVLQHAVERIASLYADRGLFGTRVDIRQRDVDSLVDRAGPLVVHIRAYPAAASQ